MTKVPKFVLRLLYAAKDWLHGTSEWDGFFAMAYTKLLFGITIWEVWVAVCAVALPTMVAIPLLQVLRRDQSLTIGEAVSGVAELFGRKPLWYMLAAYVPLGVVLYLPTQILLMGVQRTLVTAIVLIWFTICLLMTADIREGYLA